MPRLDRSQMEEAIVRPRRPRERVRAVRVRVGLVTRIVNDAGDRPDQLPLMQHALMRRWKHVLNASQRDGCDLGRITCRRERFGTHARRRPGCRSSPTQAIGLAERIFCCCATSRGGTDHASSPADRQLHQTTGRPPTPSLASSGVQARRPQFSVAPVDSKSATERRCRRPHRRRPARYQSREPDPAVGMFNGSIATSRAREHARSSSRRRAGGRVMRRG